MYCTKCGHNNIGEAQLCEDCGAEIVSNSVFRKPDSNENSTANVESHEALPLESQGLHADDTRMKEPAFAPIGKLRKSRKKRWMIVTGIIVVLAIVGLTGYVFRLQIIKKVSPEKYTQMAIERSLASAKKENLNILDLSKYEKQAASYAFSIDTLDFNTEGSLMYDAVHEKALLDLSIGAKGVTLGDNQLYVSRDLIAVSIPTAITDYKYLTADPNTFAEDWKNNGWDDIVPINNLQEYVDIFFGKATTSEDMQKFEKDSKALRTELFNAADFSTDGSVNETVGGKTLKLDVMTYTFSKNSLNDYYQNSLSLLQDSSLFDNSEYSADLNQTIEQLANVTVDKDLEIHLYIDQDGYLRKISCEEFTLAYKGEDGDVKLSFEVSLAGDRCPTDAIDAVFSYDAGGEKAEVAVGSDTSYVAGKYTSSCDVKVTTESEYSGKSSSSISLDISWDKNTLTGKNLDIQAKYNDGSSSQQGFVLSGLLTDTAKETRLSNATFDATDINGEHTKFDFDFGIKRIDPSDITVDISDSKPLLEYDPFTNLLDQYN